MKDTTVGCVGIGGLTLSPCLEG